MRLGFRRISSSSDSSDSVFVRNSQCVPLSKRIAALRGPAQCPRIHMWIYYETKRNQPIPTYSTYSTYSTCLRKRKRKRAAPVPAPGPSAGPGPDPSPLSFPCSTTCPCDVYVVLTRLYPCPSHPGLAPSSFGRGAPCRRV